MNRRILLPISFILLALLALTLAGCERDRPVEKQATAVPGRGTVAPSATPAAAGAPAAGETNATAAAPTAASAAAGEATPTAPAPQPASATQKPAAAGAAAAGQATTYTVAAGDTLAAIAKKFGVTQATIIEANNLADPNKLVLGQQLQIPGAAAGSAGAGSAASGAAASGATGSYVVQRGDTLGQIAQKYNTTVAALMELNGITNPDRIAVGQKLTVPGAGSGGQAATQSGNASGTTQTRTYTIQKGDTLLSIARRFGLTVKQLQAANNITNPDKIYPGQQLTIP